MKGTLYQRIDPTNPLQMDTDQDGLSDGEELGAYYYDAETREVFVTPEAEAEEPAANQTKATVGENAAVKMSSTSTEYYRGFSDPNSYNTDRDGDNDYVDDKPRVKFAAPPVFIHGICSNSRTAWGADTFLKNFRNNGDVKVGNPARCYSYGNEGENGNFNKNVPTKATQTRPQSGYAYLNGQQIGLGQLDAQYIRNTPGKTELEANNFRHDDNSVYPDTASNFMNKKGMVPNQDYFVFNWDAGNHVEYGGAQLEKYLIDIQDEYYNIKMKNRDITRNNGSKQTAHFQLVGHSAGGLVSRMYIEKRMNDSLPQVDRLITIDTPHWGSNGHYTNGTHVGNPGACDTVWGPIVFADLDQDDSPLWYNAAEVSREMCGDDLSHNFTNNHKPSNTEYIFIGALAAGENWRNEAPDSSTFANGPAIVPDFDVTLMSQFGIPTEKMTGKGRIPVSFDKGFLFVGTPLQVQHTHIEHQSEVLSKVYELLKG
jgi:hypothetical protein